MHSSRMRTARLLTVSSSIPCGRGLPNLPGTRTPPPMEADSIPHCRQTPSPLEADRPPPLEADRPPSLQTDLSPVDRKIDACENITLPQTSFAGGKYAHLQNKVSNESQIDYKPCIQGEKCPGRT